MISDYQDKGRRKQRIERKQDKHSLNECNDCGREHCPHRYQRKEHPCRQNIVRY